jgi:hypothetical protein
MKKEGKATPSMLNNSLLFSRFCFSISLSLFSAVGKEMGRRREIMQKDVGCARATTSFIALWFKKLGDKVAGLHRRCKKAQQK